MKISGFGNGILYIPKPTEYFNEITDIAQIYKTNNTIYNGNLVDRYGNLANGRIEAVAVFDSDGDKVVCAKHIMYDIGNVTLAEDYTPQNGDYCIAGNGKLSKSDYPTNSYIYSRTGNKYLIIE